MINHSRPAALQIIAFSVVLNVASTNQALSQAALNGNSQSSKTQSKINDGTNAAARKDAIRLTTQANQFKLRLQKIHYESNKLVVEAERLKQEAARLTKDKREYLITSKTDLKKPITTNAYQLHTEQYQAHQKEYLKHVEALQSSAKDYELQLQQFRKHFELYHHAPLPELPSSVDIPYAVGYITPCGHLGAVMVNSHRDLVSTAQNDEQDLEHLKTAEQSLSEQERLLQHAKDDRSDLEQRILGK